MAEATDRVALALNRLSDKVFMDALSDRDRGSMAELVAEFFCSAPDNPLDDDEGEDPGT